MFFIVLFHLDIDETMLVLNARFDSKLVFKKKGKTKKASFSKMKSNLRTEMRLKKTAKKRNNV
jgi:hypothetical protein